jgi:hypothetical protein
MKTLKQLGLLSAAGTLAMFTVTAAAQQAPTPPAEKPPVTSPEAAPAPAPTPAPAQKPTAKSTEIADPSKLVGLTAYSSDGSNLGDVRAVRTAPDGSTILHLRTGGFLGFGGRIVAVSQNQFTMRGQTVQLSLTSEEVSKLPEVKDAS